MELLKSTQPGPGGNKYEPQQGTNGAAHVSGHVSQSIPDYPTEMDLLASCGNFADVAPGDFVTRVETTNGQVITALSGGPMQVGESRITLDVPVQQPCALEIEASMIRARQQFATIALYEDDDAPDIVPDPINILTISQSNAVQGAAYGAAGTNVTLTLETALPSAGEMGAVFLSDWINITGLVDSRLNYQNACINWISADRKTICFGFSDEAALPSLAIPVVTPVLGTAKVNFYNNMGGAHHGFGYRFTGLTATSAALLSIFGGGDVQVSGTLLGDHRVTVGTTAPIYSSGAMGNSEIRATTRYRLEGRPSECAYSDKASDSITLGFTPRASRTAVKPALQANLRARFRLYQPIGMTRPTDEITAISKAGSTTWTVTHSGDRVYQVNEVVGIYGVRDITNFAQTVATITSIISPTQFTLVGTTGTATSYGGSVCVTNGGAAQPGIIGQNIQSVNQYTGNTDWLVAIGNTTWSGLNVGDYINLHGVRDAGGVDLAVDGAWEVANIVTSTMILKPITDIFGQRVTPTTPALGTVAVNAGGSVILRTTLRSHDLMLEEWSENKVMIDGQGSTRVDKAVPAVILNTPAVTVSSGTVTTVSTVTAITTLGTPVAPATPYFVNSAASTNGALVLTGTSGLSSLYATNTGAAAAFVKLYNKATAPTVGTDVPEMVIPVPAAVAGVPGVAEITAGFQSYRFALGLGIAITGAAADSDTTAVAASQVKVKLSRTA